MPWIEDFAKHRTYREPFPDARCYGLSELDVFHPTEHGTETRRMRVIRVVEDDTLRVYLRDLGLDVFHTAPPIRVMADGMPGGDTVGEVEALADKARADLNPIRFADPDPHLLTDICDHLESGRKYLAGRQTQFGYGRTPSLLQR